MFKWLGGLVDSNEKEIRRLEPLVDRINELESDFEQLSVAGLRSKTDDFKGRLAEATAGIRQQLVETRGELEAAKQRLTTAQNDFDEEEENTNCKRLQPRIDQLDKECQEAENEVLAELLPEAFAAVREAAKRTIGQRHFDVQLMGGIVLHQGKIAEMKTGEGKTLVATLPLYLNSLAGKGCHLVTVNDYLARRDPYWMGPIFHALGVSVASIYPQTPDEHLPSRLFDPTFDSGKEKDPWCHFRTITRKQAYEADITYGTSSEFGFDYLRDNMVVELSQCVQRHPLNFAIVDEVDNLLIDEARTPLIISGPAEESVDRYQVFARLIPRLKAVEDYTVDEKERAVTLTDAGMSRVERLLKDDNLLKTPNLYDPANYALTRYLDSSLKAYALYRRDRDYVVKNGEVIIVDEFTGRLMFGRRYSEGLHQAIEAKERVKVQQETMTFATITIQNYFRMYQKLAGMTGTAVTEAEEFYKIYKLEVAEIPTNKPMVREDFSDQIYKTEEGKFRAVVRDIEQMYKSERPVLIGTVSIEKSERLANLLMRQGVPHQVLNAKHHEKEASIIAQAGKPGAVTVATNMAGRGVDIILGGSTDGIDPTEWQKLHGKVVGLGGLHVVATERHEARRIDNQLRGRSGRQGDPGSSRFFVSLEDDIMRRFGGERIKGFMNWVGMDEDTPIENALVNKTIGDVQKRVEGYHFDMRKHLVEYDDVVNKHRELVYDERRKILSGADLKSNILGMVTEEIKKSCGAHLAGYLPDYEGVAADITAIFPLPPDVNAEALGKMSTKEIEAKLIDLAESLYEAREKEIGADNMRILERLVMLRIIDSLWIEHLTMMEHMRLEAEWQTLRQTRAVDAYKNEGYKQFQLLLSTIRHDVALAIYHVSIVRKEAPAPAPSPMVRAVAPRPSSRQPVKSAKKVGRNEPCPCGSGKKYKHCHGR